ncbi:hypothetical protein ACNIST_25755, partial [Escherichia coli]
RCFFGFCERGGSVFEVLFLSPPKKTNPQTGPGGPGADPPPPKKKTKKNKKKGGLFCWGL